ncbi:phenylacetate--CoA ligase family protein [Rhodococcus sp. NPDC019627]|uniref:phenylacetate--CoA ligase family protein n=1 Tax=unclassified Rhodococcus (in: high G+C Gram-positive bacteria) TaxID=192944 RepID=UPI0033DE2F0A
MQDPNSPYWDRERETMDPGIRDKASFEALKNQLARCYAEIPFYRRLWDKHGFDHTKVETFADFTASCPVVTKKMLVADQAAYPPFGSYLGIDPSEIFRIHGSSGTSGTPTMYGVSREEWEQSREIYALTHWSIGVRPDDIVLFAFPFGLFFGGWGMLHAAESVGAKLLPMGAATTQAHVEMIYKMGCTVIEGTPSYLIRLADAARDLGYDPAKSPLKRALLGGEPGGSIPATKQRIIDEWGLISACDSGTSSEMFPFCTSTECTEMQGLHLYNDEIWTEIVEADDPYRAVPEGEVGHLVYTHLHRRSQPMIRFAVGDRSYLTREPCPCGRTYPRLPQGLMGRVDDTLVIRGANVYPTNVEHVLRSFPEVGAEFRIQVSTRNHLDELLVQVEIADREMPESEKADLGKRLESALTTHCLIRVPVELVPPDTLPRAALKARRVVDHRK